jgi:flavin-dependent dehydrogenase
MSVPEVDILVVGGGPSGLAAGIRARQHGLTVQVVDRQEPPIDKACGEGLMPAGVSALSALGVELPAGHPIRGIRYRDGDAPEVSAAARFPGGDARGIRREVLHRALWEHAAGVGVQWDIQQVNDVQMQDDGVAVGGHTARWLVAADGLHSTVRRSVGLARRGGREGSHSRGRYGIRRHFRCEPWTDHVEVWWRKGCEAYVTPVADQTIGVAFLYDGGRRYDDLLSSFPALKSRIQKRGGEPATQIQGAGPFSCRTAAKRKGRCLLVGDAAGYVDALTGEGVSVGVRTAMAAVDCIADGRAETYETDYWLEAGSYLGATAALLKLTRSRQVHRPMIRFLDAYPGIFRRILGHIGG